MPWAGRRVLVTGHTGFKGAWLTRWLQRLGADVHGLSATDPAEPALAADLPQHRADVRDAAAVTQALTAARPEVVFHLAAQAIVRRALADPAATWAINVIGTANLLQTLPDSVRAVVVVTSDKCYRDVASGRTMTEDDPLGGADPYSASKAAQELVVAAHRRSFLAERGVAVATARAGNVIGGGDWGPDRLVPDLVRAARAGRPLTLRNPDAVRPWQHVLNPLSGYLRLAERLLDGDDAAEAWNLGPDAADARPVAWVVERLRERWPGTPPEVLVQASDGREAAVLRLDSAKARERLGWTPRWDLARGLDATVEWYASDDPRAATDAQLEAYDR